MTDHPTNCVPDGVYHFHVDACWQAGHDTAVARHGDVRELRQLAAGGAGQPLTREDIDRADAEYARLELLKAAVGRPPDTGPSCVSDQTWARPVPVDAPGAGHPAIVLHLAYDDTGRALIHEAVLA